MNQEQRSHNASCIRLVPIFNHLEEEIMNVIAEKAVTREYKKDEFIYQAADETEVLFIVHSGAVRIYRLVDSGKEQLVRILGPGDFAGEWSIFNAGSYHEDYAQAMQDSSVCIIYQKDLNAFLMEYPEISIKLLNEMSKRLKESEKQTTTLSTEQVDKRLALYIADQVTDEEGENVMVDLALSRKDIASYLGTTPETISRKFKELEDKGLIVQLSPRKIKVIDLDDLLFYI